MADSQYHEVDGLYISKSFPVESVRSGLRYQAQLGDLFIVSYPKCGTTWMQHIVYNIINNRPPPRNQLACITEMPFLELQGAEAVEDMRRPGPIKTHLAFPLQPYSSDAKYIYVTRNPYDCCVSFFYHTRDMPDYHFEEGTFDQFFDMFLEGKVDFGDYFDHVLSWYEHRNDPNVLFVTYEQLKENIRSCVLKIADFLGDEFGQKLRNDESCLENVLRNVSLASMKEGINDSMKNVSDGLELLPSKKMPKWCELVMETVGKETFEKPMKGEFIRKGIVGDWRNHFSAEQVQRLKHKIEERTRGIDIMSIWKDTDIPK